MLTELAYSDVLLKLLPIVISLGALSVTLWDRRAKLTLKVKTGDDWFLIRKVRSTRGWEDQFEGIIECYNTSGRASAIRGYKFWMDCEGGWQECCSQQYQAVPTGGVEIETYNPTPLTLPPYTGVNVFVMGLSPHTVDIKKRRLKIEIEDIFGNTTQVKLTAYS